MNVEVGRERDTGECWVLLFSVYPLSFMFCIFHVYVATGGVLRGKQDGFPAGRLPGPGPACRALALAHQSVSGRPAPSGVGGVQGAWVTSGSPARLRQGLRAQWRLCNCYLER